MGELTDPTDMIGMLVTRVLELEEEMTRPDRKLPWRDRLRGRDSRAEARDAFNRFAAPKMAAELKRLRGEV